MYVPSPFREDDPVRLHALMLEHGFATLITAPAGDAFASHLPLLHEAERGPHGLLAGHMARANPQWRSFDGVGTALAIFQGPHCYVSPSWYANAANVPTWNYVAVHAYGAPRVVEDESAVRAHLARMVETHESGFETPWRLGSLSDDSVATLIRGIVAFEMPVARIEGKFKLNQNREPADRAAVRALLARSGDQVQRAVGALMAERP